MSTRLYADPRCLAHDAGPMHPESPARVSRVVSLLEQVPVEHTRWADVRPATREELVAVHTPSYVDQLAELADRPVQLDPDTRMSEGSHLAALLAAGAAVQAVEEVWSGHASNAFALVRPPGHHAEQNRAMGFCLFNNVAVAAEAARRAGAQRVLVLDWDVHHGNGTQSAFYSRRDVLYLSSHQFPFYPGTGAPQEVGEGPGEGFTVNCGLSPGQGDAEYGTVFSELFLPIAQAYRPELVLVSAGFDPHQADPLAGMRVTERGFAAMCSAMNRLAKEVCEGKLVLLLEGGYDLDALSQSVHACVEVLALDRKEDFPHGATRAVQPAVEASLQALRPYWKGI